MPGSGKSWLPDLYETGYCLTFARGLTPEELLSRLGADLSISAHMTLTEAAEKQTGLPWSQSVVRVGAHRDWAYSIEDAGSHGARPAILENVSEGTQALALLKTADITHRFTFAEFGHVVCSFDPTTPNIRSGSDPDRLLSWLERLTASATDGEIINGDDVILRMASEAFNAYVPRSHVATGRLLSGVLN
ncbi:hypothetical protein E1265_09570 [Streptomyces sp. 8K308]|uniref:DUF6461 domain-containing protein n=1 Tax=Streptomyces sp. 8K308 TaxID=2530388 RepID=UPI00104329D3|nr:DUF6461 domain-containing protein [Streptomyces sp. 8K308]TDC24479.1 hypothetical protein E1265_09570 [Streptomyces sp. 8K308]